MIRFCPSCSATLPGFPPVSCGSCGYALFVNPRPTGLTIILDGLSVLVVLRAHEPQAGLWALPGGFCDGWETPAQAAVREAYEELGVCVELTGFVGMFLGDYRYQRETLPVLDCFWTARIASGNIHLNPRELGGYKWANIADTPPMAFETMQSALDEVARNLIGRV